MSIVCMRFLPGTGSLGIVSKAVPYRSNPGKDAKSERPISGILKIECADAHSVAGEEMRAPRTRHRLWIGGESSACDFPEHRVASIPPGIQFRRRERNPFHGLISE